MNREMKFKIGEQYEKHEFELDWVNYVLDNTLRYEIYKYIGKDKMYIFGYEVQKILLAYNCDFLAGSFYFIKRSFNSKTLSEIPIEFSNTSNVMISVIKISESILLLYYTNRKISKNFITSKFMPK